MKKHWTGFAGGVYGTVGLPRDCRGLFNWGHNFKNIREFDESFMNDDERSDEIRRLSGAVIPENQFPYVMHVCSAHSAGVFEDIESEEEEA